MLRTNWKNWAVGGVAALTIMTGGLYAAEPASAASPDADAVEVYADSPLLLMRSGGVQVQRDFGMRPGARAGIDGDALLAEALGVTVEELDAAREIAKSKALDEALAQAVADGKLTQQQADAIKTLQGLRDGRFADRMPLVGDYDVYLAEALGVSEEQLAAARDSAWQAGIEQALADGVITQEQADAMLMRLALKDYVQTELETAFETAIQKAVADGVITQEQADELLSQREGGFRRGVFGLPGVHGGMRGGMHAPGFDRGMRDGMRGGFPRGQWVGSDDPETQSYNEPLTDPNSLL